MTIRLTRSAAGFHTRTGRDDRRAQAAHRGGKAAAGERGTAAARPRRRPETSVRRKARTGRHDQARTRARAEGPGKKMKPHYTFDWASGSIKRSWFESWALKRAHCERMRELTERWNRSCRT